MFLALPECSPKLGLFAFFVYVDMLQTTKNNHGNVLKHVFHISTFGRLRLFLSLVGPKQLASPSVSKELFDGGILKSFGNLKILETLKRR